MKLQRAIGQTSQILNIFVQDASVSTGAGLANIPATTVSYSWFHNTVQAAVSSGVAVSTASMGTYTSGAWTQISSSLALGWYQFGLPDGALAAGDSVGVHLYVSTGAFAMAPLPIEIEIVRDNPIQFSSSKVFLAYTSTSPANVVQIQTSSAATAGNGILQASTQALTYTVNVSAWANSSVVATSSGIVDVNLVNIWNKSAVTSNPGILTVSTQSLVGIVVSTQSLAGIVVSTQTVDKTGYIVNVSAWANSSVVATSSGVVDVNLVNIWNKSAVTTNSGILQVSTQSLAGITVSTQSLVGIVVSTQSLAGIVVSTQTIDKTGYSLVAGYDPAKTASQAGDAMALTSAERGTLAGVILSTTQPESYRASSATASITQMMYEVLANVTDMGNSGTTRALNSVTSHVANSVQYQYDSTTPSSISRIA